MRRRSRVNEERHRHTSSFCREAVAAAARSEHARTRWHKLPPDFGWLSLIASADKTPACEVASSDGAAASRADSHGLHTSSVWFCAFTLTCCNTMGHRSSRMVRFCTASMLITCVEAAELCFHPCRISQVANSCLLCRAMGTTG